MTTKIEELQRQMDLLKGLIEKETKREKVLGDLKALAEKNGFTLEELVMPEPAPVAEVKRRGRPAGATPKAAKGPTVVKYRKGDQEWSGRGRRPAWYVEAEAAGEDMSSYLVAPVTA